MKPLHRRTLIFVVAIVVIAVGYFGYRFYAASQRGVPQEFSEARSEGAAVAEKIVASSNAVVAAIAQLSSPTTTPVQASSTIGQVSEKVAEIRRQAVELSRALGVMATAVPEVRSSEAQQAALQAISERLELVEHLVAYTTAVDNLTIAIRSRIQAGARNGAEIARLVKEINTEVGTVNKLNNAANRSMDTFDSLLRSGGN